MRPFRHPATITAIGLLFVAGAACGSDDDDSSAPSGDTPAATDQVEVVGFQFKPKAITVKSGATVSWTFKDDTDHNVKLDDGSFQSDDLKSGATTNHTFASPGTYGYKCGIHTTMTGSVTVT